MSRLRLLLDLMVSGIMPLVAVWIYEVSNWLVFAAEGSVVSLSLSGVIPIGVSGVSSGGVSPLTKLLQMTIGIGLLLPLGLTFSRTRLQIATCFVISSAGVFLASAYWEALSLLAVVTPAVHIGVFIAATGALVFALLLGVNPQIRTRGLPAEKRARRTPFG